MEINTKLRKVQQKTSDIYYISCLVCSRTKTQSSLLFHCMSQQGIFLLYDNIPAISVCCHYSLYISFFFLYQHQLIAIQYEGLQPFNKILVNVHLIQLHSMYWVSSGICALNQKRHFLSRFCCLNLVESQRGFIMLSPLH